MTAIWDQVHFANSYNKCNRFMKKGQLPYHGSHHNHMKALYEKVQTANPREKIPDARVIDHTN